MATTNKVRKQFTNNVIDVASALISLNVTGKVIPVASIFAGTFVGEGNIIRIQTTADTFVAFRDETGIALPTVTTTPAVKLIGAGVFYVVAQCDFVRTSIAVTRVELLEL